jgi:hypothetical protein
MLDACAPAWTKELRDHNYCIRCRELTYPAFPRGDRSRSNPDIQLSHVRKLARHFGIEACAERELPVLKQ